MKPQRILLPLDVRRCPPGVFEVINRFARRSQVVVTLLHVVTLNVSAWENRVYEELVHEASWYFQQLARKYLGPGIPACIRVRLGKVEDEILAEARAIQPDLVLLPVHHLSLEKKLVFPKGQRASPTVSGLARRIIAHGPCNVMVVPMTVYFDCAKEWGRPLGQSSPALDKGTPATKATTHGQRLA